MTIKITLPQLQMLSAVRKAGPEGYRFSLRSDTLHALKTRGYVDTQRTPASTSAMDLLWVATEEGAALLERMGR